MILEWGCPKCRCAESWVTDTDRDSDGYMIRRRRCTQCRTVWATEERPIKASYYQRATRRNAQRRAYRSRVPRICARCDGRYVYGQFRNHVARSKQHAAALKPPANGAKRETVRRYARERWRRLNQPQVDTAA